MFTDTFERQSCDYWTRYSLEDSNVLVERENGRLYIILCRITSRKMVSILDDEEIVLAHDIISGGKGNVLWKRHLLKYHHLKCMVWVVVNTANRGKDGFVMLDEISESFTSYIEQRYAAAKVNVEAAKSKPAQSRFYLRNLKSKLDGLDIDQLKYLHLLLR